ncbi:MAG: ABC transporter ATP-binding protein [Xanthomonadales bacterium]|nr:ABC transporter ATP-binding protein [Xanthomonadales bacterium]
MNRPTLSVRDLVVVVHGREGSRRIVDGVGFDLAPAKVLGLVGESGSGKSTIAKALMGLLQAGLCTVQAGRMTLGQTNLAALTEKGWQKLRGREMSMIFQEPLTCLDPVFTVGQQLVAVLRRHRHLSRREARDAAAHLLGTIGFADALDLLASYPHQLSGGMRQRIMLAMAMGCDPAVLIADEPTSALDVTTQAQVLMQLTALGRERQTAILLITHDLGVVAQYCDHALVIREGKIVEAAPVRKLFEAPTHPYTRSLLAAVPTIRARRHRGSPRTLADQL